MTARQECRQGRRSSGSSQGAAWQGWQQRGYTADAAAKGQHCEGDSEGGYDAVGAAGGLLGRGSRQQAGSAGVAATGAEGGCEAVMAAKRLQGGCGVHKLALRWVCAARGGNRGPAMLWEQLRGCTAVGAATGLHCSGAEGLGGSQEAATQ